MNTRCPAPLLHEIARASIEDVTEVVKAAVLLIEDKSVVEFNRFPIDHPQRAAYDRLAQAVRRIK